MMEQLLSADGVSELLVHLLVLEGEKQKDFYNCCIKTKSLNC